MFCKLCGGGRLLQICERAVNFVQVINGEGEVRLCSWNKNNVIGSLLENTMPELIHSDKAHRCRMNIINGTYLDCPADNCPYLANGTIGQHLLEVDDIPDYPEELYLAFEGNCNYNCTCCTSHMNMQSNRNNDYSENYRIIENRISCILPHIKKISAHGRGELFASPHILKILSEWQPNYPQKEISVSLETNGSLFNEKNWLKISNLGQYNLSVAITIMSFKEDVYQYLSGTKLPLQNLIDNLLFVKSLRETGVINHLQLATVLQEQNYREMPEFTRRCIEEFGADCVRIRPIMPGGPMDENAQWFMDVRNPYHPYYNEYKKVMADDIFKHPKVLLWSADLDSFRGEIPCKVRAEENSKKLLRGKLLEQNLNALLSCTDINEVVQSIMQNYDCQSVSVYGMGVLGKLLLRLIDDAVIMKLYDRKLIGCRLRGREVVKFCNEDQAHRQELVIITPIFDADNIKEAMYKAGVKKAILVSELVPNA